MWPLSCQNDCIMTVSDVWQFVSEVVSECRENKVGRLAAALAYYALFSLAPLLLLVLSIIGAVYGSNTAEQTVFAQFQALVGTDATEALHTLLQNIRSTTSGVGTTVVGVVGLLIGSSALFHHIKESLNTMWAVTLKPGNGVLTFLRSRALAVIMVLNLSIIALLGLAFSLSLEALGVALAAEFPTVLPWYIVRGAELLLAFLIMTLVVALTYKVLPDIKVQWRVVWFGASLTAMLIVASQALLGLYLRTSPVESGYSLLGAVVIVLIWVYYASMAFFFGAACTWVYANRYGSPITPSRHAVSLTAGDRAAQGILRTSELAATIKQQAQERETSAHRTQIDSTHHD